MTDLEKWKEFLNSMNVGYEIHTWKTCNEIAINKHFVHQEYGSLVSIVFNKDNSFKEFEGWGE